MKFTLRQSECNPGQWKLLNSQAWAVLLAGGYGSGKTTGLVRKMLQLRMVNGRNIPGVLTAQTHKAMMSVVYENLTRQLTAAMGRQKAARYLKIHDKNSECYLDWGGTGPIYLRSATNPAAMDGLDLGWLCGDELRYWPRKSFEVAQSRARMKCPLNQRAYSSTPAIGFMSEEFNTGKEARQLIVAPTKENTRNLDPGYVDRLRQSYSPRLQKAVIDGYFVPLEGAVYEALDPDVWTSDHVVEHDPHDWPHARTYLAVDPGFRRSAWLWIHQTGPTEWVVFDELMLDDVPDVRAVELVNARGWPIDEIWIDPAGDNVQSAAGITTAQVLEGIKCRTPAPVRYLHGRFREISFGVERVRSLLDWGDIRRQVPRLRFATRLRDLERGAHVGPHTIHGHGIRGSTNRGIVKDMLAYCYPEPTPGIAKRLDVPVKDGLVDHSCDALRYWGVGMWMTVPELRTQLAVVERLVAA